jgi:pimeloyl-ACP methyl ester carboxylesterase
MSLRCSCSISLFWLLAGCAATSSSSPSPAPQGLEPSEASLDRAERAKRPGREGETRTGEEAAKEPPTAEARGAEEPALEEPPRGPKTVQIALPGFEPAFVVVPPGKERRPLLVATHGAWDRADWHCAMWQGVVGDRAFVLCPRGKRVSALQPGPEALYYYPTHFYIEREIEAALGAMREAFGERLDAERAVYAGFSQGAIMGGLVVARNPARFPRAILIEGSYGHGQWAPVMGQMFRRRGGERVLFACGGWFCGGQARTSAEAIERAGAKARVVVTTGGHTYGGAVGRAVADAFGWAVEGDARWAAATDD